MKFGFEPHNLRKASDHLKERMRVDANVLLKAVLRESELRLVSCQTPAAACRLHVFKFPFSRLHILASACPRTLPALSRARCPPSGFRVSPHHPRALPRKPWSTRGLSEPRLCKLISPQ